MNKAPGALRQVLMLLGGAGLAQAIALAASPLLSRLFAPEQFGVFALFASVVTLVSTAATGRYELAVILPPGDDEAWRVARLALAIAVPVSVLSGAVVLFAGDALALRAGDARLAAWLWLLPLAVLLTAVINTLTVWANRRQAYRRIATNRVAQSAVTAAASIGLGAAGAGSAGLIAGSVLGQAVASGMLLGGRSATTLVPGAPDVRVPLRDLAARYRDFPRINLPHALLDAAQASLVLALIGAAYGAPVLGAYAFALRIARTPLAMLGASVGQVFQQRAARLVESRGDVAGLARRTTARLAAIGLPFALALLVAPELFAWVFGEEWRGAGEIARILMPWMVLNFATSPLSQLPLIVGRQSTALIFGIAYQLAMVLPFALGAWLAWPALSTFAWQSATASIVLVVYGLWLHRLARSVR